MRENDHDNKICNERSNENVRGNENEQERTRMEE